jgi:hypothetical protein
VKLLSQLPGKMPAGTAWKAARPTAPFVDVNGIDTAEPKTELGTRICFAFRFSNRGFDD